MAGTRQEITITEGAGEKIELTDKQIAFCEEYLISNNATEAARVAGYVAKELAATGNEVLRNPKIQKYLMYRRQQIASESKLELDQIIFNLVNIGFTTIDKVMEWGKKGVVLKDLSEIPPEALPAIAEISQVTRGKETHIKVKLKDSMKALDMLIRIHGWYKDEGKADGRDGGSKLMQQLREQYQAQKKLK